MALRRLLVPLVLCITLGSSAGAATAPASAAPRPTAGTPTAIGYGGAVATVDATATAVGLDVLRRGGNAVDAAVAAAATLGVTEPFTSGIGGGGFFAYYDAGTRSVHTLDGRETAPASMGADAFINPDTGQPYAFQEARVSGSSVGVPGSPATWAEALRRWGTISWRSALRPAMTVAERGFVVDDAFHNQVASNLDAFGQFSSTSALYLPGG